MRILSKSEIENMSTRDELKFMRNEIFARYGYMFEPKGRMDRYFSNTDWYKPQYDDVTQFFNRYRNTKCKPNKETELNFSMQNYLKGFSRIKMRKIIIAFISSIYVFCKNQVIHIHSHLKKSSFKTE